MNEFSSELPQHIQRTRLAILSIYYALLAYFALNAVVVFEEIRLVSLVIWLIQIIPLLLFVVGLHRTRLRTFAWLCFVVLLYFMHGVLVAFQPQRLWLGLIEVTLCSLLFIFLILFIRQYRDYYRVPL